MEDWAIMKYRLIVGYKESILIEYGEKDDKFILNMSGKMRGSEDQCSSEMYHKYIKGSPGYHKKAELARLLEIWDRYHMNNMNPGTPKQMEIIRGSGLDYKDALDYLEEFDLKIDDGHLYGSKWLFEKIPDSVVLELKQIIKDW